MAPLSTVSRLNQANSNALIDKIVHQMKGDDSTLRKKVLHEINEDFHQADKLNEALDSGILMCLVYCCREQCDITRELASRAILKIANTEKGRVTLVSSRSLAIVANLFDDNVT